MKSIILFLSLITIAFSAFAQWEQINGPKNDFGVNKILSKDSLLMVSTSCGTYYSFNGGIKWIPLNTSKISCSAIFQDTIYATDLALDKVKYGNDSVMENDVNINNSNSNYGYPTSLFSTPNVLYSIFNYQEFVYSYNGKDWTFGSTNGLPIDTGYYRTGAYYYSQFYSISANTQYVFIGTDHGIFRSSINNYLWKNTNNGIPSSEVASILTKDSLVVIASQVQQQCCDTDSVKIYKSVNNGDSWIKTYALPLCTINSIKNINDTLFISTSSQGPNYNGNGILVSYDFGSTWTKLNTGPLVNIYDIEEHNNNLFIACDSGIYKNINQLFNINNNISCSSIISLAKNDSCISSVYYNEAGNKNIVGITQNEGKTWTGSSNNLPIDYLGNVISLNNKFLFSGNYSGITDTPRCINYLSSDNGKTWNQQSTLDYNYGVGYRLETSGNRIVAFTENVIVISLDTGKTWKDITPPSGLLSCNYISSSLFVKDDIYITECGNSEVIKSTDFGASWNLINNGLPSSQEYIICGYYNGIILITSSNILYATSDNGANWQQWSNQYLSFGDIVSDAQNIYTTDGTDIYFSNDSAKTWNYITGNLPAGGSCLLAKDNYLYCGTSGLGIWRRNTQNLPLSVKKINTPLLLSLFPNPAIDNVFIQSTFNTIIKQADIINLSGEVVLSEKTGKTTICISQLETGFYIVRVVTTENIYYFKLVKH